METENEELDVSHEGHRARIRSALRENGMLGFPPHEALELALYIALPRRDVNGLAHRLIDAFGSVWGVLTAETDELTEKGGVSLKTARLLRAFGGACRVRREADMDAWPLVSTRAEAEKLAARFAGESGTLLLVTREQRVVFIGALPRENPEAFVFAHAAESDAADALVYPKRALDTARLSEALSFIGIPLTILREERM